MCVLILLCDPAPGVSLIVAANRDEFISRPSAPPMELAPGVLGGKDLQGGGTWLGLNRHGLLVAVTNRRTPPRAPDATSRGLLCVEALGRQDPREVESWVAQRVGERKFAGFNLVAMKSGRGVCLHYDGGLRPAKIDGGVHVVSSHRDLDDPAMPEAAVVRTRLAPGGDLDRILASLEEILRDHPEVCKHVDGYGTVSSTILVMREDGGIRYLYAAGPSCRTPFGDCSALARGIIGA